MELSRISEKVKIPLIPKGSTHSYQMYTITVNSKIRDKLLNFLKKNKIEASAHFVPPLHLQKYLKKFNKNKLPVTEKLSKEIITLPIYPDMKKSEALFVINIIKKFYKSLDI